MRLSSTERRLVDLNQALVDATLCTYFNADLDGTPKPVDRRRVRLADAAQLRALALDAVQGNYACSLVYVTGAPNTYVLEMRIKGKSQPERVVISTCGGVLRGGQTLDSPQVQQSLERVRQGSVVYFKYQG